MSNEKLDRLTYCPAAAVCAERGWFKIYKTCYSFITLRAYQVRKSERKIKFPESLISLKGRR